MFKIRHTIIALGIAFYSATAPAQVSIGIGLPHVSIGINLPVYPQLVRVPGYPVYYAPRLDANFFFYDGMYWVYQSDNWYASSWYNGPWEFIDPMYVPVYVLRVPVRYYRQPPAYFYGWRPDAPPRWGNHWGHDWEQNRRGWDNWNRRAAPAPAPLPTYQRQYSKDRYPQQVEQQHQLQQQHYRYQPRDPVVQQRYQEQAKPLQERQKAPEQRNTRQQDAPADSRSQPPQQGRPEAQDRRQSQQPAPNQREQQLQKSQGRENVTREPKQGQGQGQGQERGRDRNE